MLITPSTTLGVGGVKEFGPHITSRRHWILNFRQAVAAWLHGASAKDSSVMLSIAFAEVTTAEAGMCVYFYARTTPPIPNSPTHPPTHWLSSWPGPYNYRENIDSSVTFLPPDASTEYTVYSCTSVSNNCTQQACIVCISESTCVCVRTEALIRGLERCSEDCALLFSILASRPSSLLSVSIRFRGARLLHSPLSPLPHQH